MVGKNNRMLLFKFIHAAQAVLLFVAVPALLFFSVVAFAKRKPTRATVAATACVAALLIYMSSGFESYCYIYPSIDTRYTGGFSERAFARIQIGMTRDEVSNLLGAPFGGVSGEAEKQWNYTQDGKCQWADWAWLGRTVVFENNRVVGKVARVWYD